MIRVCGRENLSGTQPTKTAKVKIPDSVLGLKCICLKPQIKQMNKYLFSLCFLYQLQGSLIIGCSVDLANISVHYVGTQDVLHTIPVKTQK